MKILFSLGVFFVLITFAQGSLHVHGTLAPSDAAVIEGIAHQTKFPESCFVERVSTKDYHVTLKPIQVDRKLKGALKDPDEEMTYLVKRAVCSYVSAFQNIRWRVSQYSGKYGRFGVLEIHPEYDTTGPYRKFLPLKPHISILKTNNYKRKAKKCRRKIKMCKTIPSFTFVFHKICTQFGPRNAMTCMDKQACANLERPKRHYHSTGLF